MNHFYPSHPAMLTSQKYSTLDLQQGKSKLSGSANSYTITGKDKKCKNCHSHFKNIPVFHWIPFSDVDDCLLLYMLQWYI